MGVKIRRVARSAPIFVVPVICLAAAPFLPIWLGHISDSNEAMPIERAVVTTSTSTTTSSTTTTTTTPPPTTQVTYHIASSNNSLKQRIGGCECCGDPNAQGGYTAQNPTTTASGRYQALDSTWQGYHGYSKAKYAPPDVQEQWMDEALKGGTGPWVSSKGCWTT
jgi:hypothetical protein